MMYRSYSYRDMPQPIMRRDETPPKPEPPKPEPQPARPNRAPNEAPRRQSGVGGILKDLKSDDMILIAVILVLLADGCDDKLLLAALGFIFFSDLL